jgi:hypothetical protein
LADFRVAAGFFAAKTLEGWVFFLARSFAAAAALAGRLAAGLRDREEAFAALRPDAVFTEALVRVTSRIP